MALIDCTFSLVLPGPACVVSAVLLVAVSSLMFRVVWSFGSCILVKVLPKIALLSLLVEVLPRSALRSFRATVVLFLWFEVCRLVGPRSGEVLPGRLLALFGGGSAQGCFVLFWLSLLSLSYAWALSVKVSCPWLCVWLLHWPACLVSRFQVFGSVGGGATLEVPGEGSERSDRYNPPPVK
ncbi:hypothetical protein Taro_035000 [Colocasia esculenta]|uniref:Transmembrane protein n=1 Tax=Colocasia esculenta TaxID=4460 RepID=A0A843VZ90_COLES|nr:hypothetical protein [Colocasia esculenta]